MNIDYTYTASSLNSDWLNDDGEVATANDGVATANDGVATASDNDANEPSEQATEQETAVESIVQKRRGLLDEKLKEFRQEKMKRKLPMDAQLLDCARRAAGKEKAS